MTDTFEIGQAEETYTIGEAGTLIVVRRGAFSLSGGQTDLTFVAGFDRPITLATALATYGLGSLPNGTLVPVMAQASAADNGVYTVASGALVDRVAWTADDNNRGVEIGVMVVVPDELNPSGYVFRVDRQVSFDFANSVFALGPRGLDSGSGAGVAIAGAVAELGWERGRPDLTPTHAMQFTGIAAGILVADVAIPAPTTSFEGWAIVRFDPRPPGDADFAAGFMELPTHVWEPPVDYDPTDFYGVGQDGPQPPVDGEIDSPEWAAHRTQVAGVGETQVFPPGTITSFLEGVTIEHVTTDPEPNEDWSSYQDVGLRDGDVWQLMYIKWTPGQVIHGAASEVAPSIDSDGTLQVPRIRTVTHTLPAAETIFDPTGLPGARWIVGRNFQGEIAMWAYKTDGVLRSHVVASDMTVGATTLTDRVGSRTWEPDPELAGGSEIVAVGGGGTVDEYRLLPETIGDPGQSAVVNDAGTGPWYVTPVKGLDTPTVAGRPVVWNDTLGRQLAMGVATVPASRQLAGLDLTADRTAAALKTALSLAIADVTGLQAALDAKAAATGFVPLAADHNVADSSITLANVTGLSRSVVNGVTYDVTIKAFVTTTTNACDLRLGATFPSGSIKLEGVGPQPADTAATPAIRNLGVVTASAGFVEAGAVMSTTQLVTLTGTYVATASGTFQVQAAQATSTGSAGLKILALSSLELRPVA